MGIKYVWARLLKKVRGASIAGTRIDPTSKVESGSQVVHSSFARHSYCGYDCTIIHARVGSFCSIANGVSIGGARHPVEFVSTSPVFLSHRDSVRAKFSRHTYAMTDTTVVGNDVWIGERALIKAGVTVGHGAVVGMGSVVTKDVPPYAIVAGNPARLVRMRFDDDTIRVLLDYQWWNLSDAELRGAATHFADIASFVKFVRDP